MPESEDETQKRMEAICKDPLEFVLPILSEERVREIAREETLLILAARDEQSRKFWEAAYTPLLTKAEIKAKLDA